MKLEVTIPDDKVEQLTELIKANNLVTAEYNKSGIKAWMENHLFEYLKLTAKMWNYEEQHKEARVKYETALANINNKEIL